jgi:hypothetical protein
MGWSYGTNNEGRAVGYGVEAECDYPECSTQIDRGLGYICGDMHAGMNEWGCADYFCAEHLYRDDHPNGPCEEVPA